MKEINKNGQNSVATSAQKEKGYIQVITKNNGKLFDFTEKEYKSVEVMDEDYKEFVKYYTKQYMMHTSEDLITTTFSESAVKLDAAEDNLAYTCVNNKARKMHYRVDSYSVDVYKVEFVEA